VLSIWRLRSCLCILIRAATGTPMYFPAYGWLYFRILLLVDYWSTRAAGLMYECRIGLRPTVFISPLTTLTTVGYGDIGPVN